MCNQKCGTSCEKKCGSKCGDDSCSKDEATSESSSQETTDQPQPHGCGENCGHDHSEEKDEYEHLSVWKEFLDSYKKGVAEIEANAAEKNLPKKEKNQAFEDFLFSFLEKELNMPFDKIAEEASKYLISDAETIAKEFAFIGKDGRYDKPFFETDDIAKYLKTEASKKDNWRYKNLSFSKDHNLVEMQVACISLGRKDYLDVVLFLNRNGKVMHKSFVAGNES